MVGAVELAESVSLDGRLVAIFLALVFILALLVLAVVVGGMIAAYRAGKGSTNAFVFMAVSLGLEATALVALHSAPPRGWATILAIIGLQGALYLVGRAQ